MHKVLGLVVKQRACHERLESESPRGFLAHLLEHVSDAEPVEQLRLGK